MASSVSDGAGRDVAQSQKASTKSANGPQAQALQSVQDRVPSPDIVAGTAFVSSQIESGSPEVVVHHMESDRESNAVEHPTESDALTTVVDLLLRANRFSPLSVEIDDEPLPPIDLPAFRRRLTLVGVTRQNQHGESGADSLQIPGTPAGDQVGSQDEHVAPAVVAAVARDVAEDELMVTRTTRDAFASLVGVNLNTIFPNRACIMGSPPCFMCGARRAAMRFVLEEVESGVDAHDEQRICQGWKLFLLLPRMLLHPARGGLVPMRKLMERFAAITRGEWTELLIASRDCAEAAAQGRK